MSNWRDLVHLQERHFPPSGNSEHGLIVTKCGKPFPYTDFDHIVLWAEKEVTCPECISTVKAAIAKAEGRDD